MLHQLALVETRRRYPGATERELMLPEPLQVVLRLIQAFGKWSVPPVPRI